MTMRSEFTDRVIRFGTDGDQVTVLFAGMAAGYEIPVTAADIGALLAAIAVSWQHQRPLDVVVEGTRIVSAKARGRLN